MWKLYNYLIENIPNDIKVNDLVIGSDFAVVISDFGAGISRVLNEKRFPFENKVKPNMRLKDLAKSIKSWNFVEASLGLAAINSFYNIKKVQNNFKLEKIKHPFVSMVDSDDRIAVVDAVLENKVNIQKSYDVDFFNRVVEDDDYLITAFEYLVDEYDLVYLGSNLIVNKHIMKIASDSVDKKSMLCDISVPLSLDFKKIGIEDIGGFIIEDIDRCFELVKISAPYQDIQKTGSMFKIIDEKEC